MSDFHQFALPASLQKALDHMQFTTPTPIQEQAIPPALEGRDILGTAQTGTGKTGAFGVPLVAKLMNNSRGSAMVLTPTRELAVQVMKVIEQMIGKQSSIKAALLIGGEPMRPQIQALRNRPRIIVGTPGRINDHLEQGNLMLMDTNTLVLDETDRMLDMGFSIQIDRILKFLPKARQTLLFSATMPKEIVRMSEKYLNNPVRIAVGEANKVAANLIQEIIHTTAGTKYEDLVSELRKREGSVIIFVKTKFGTEKLAKRLHASGMTAEAIHGDLQQRKRERVILGFRDERYRILVATDIAARGLDIPHVRHIVNFDLPHCPEDYIHRIGRTARAGAEGSAVSLIMPDDMKRWKAIDRMMNPNAAPAASERSESSRPGAPSKHRRPRSRSRRPAGNQVAA